jgi:magnesium-transporting ATPase (P-type)
MEQSTLSKPGEETTTQRYEEARAAAHRAMTSVTLIPDTPPAEQPAEPERLSYRGFKFGAAFFGWLIMVSMLVLLSAVVAGAATAAYYILGYTRTDLEDQAGTVAVSAASAVVLVITVAYYFGGYVAGRLARFDGMRQGFGVWMISLLLIVCASSVGAFLNSNYDYSGRIHRPHVPLTDDSLLTGGLITAAALLMLPLLFALLGGRTGQRYHDKIDDLIP